MRKSDTRSVRDEMDRPRQRLDELDRETTSKNSETYDWLDNRYTAAVRRSSMDLTRALSKLRAS